jgi:hypothetical protein
VVVIRDFSFTGQQRDGILRLRRTSLSNPFFVSADLGNAAGMIRSINAMSSAVAPGAQPCTIAPSFAVIPR